MMELNVKLLKFITLYFFTINKIQKLHRFSVFNYPFIVLMSRFFCGIKSAFSKHLSINIKGCSIFLSKSDKANASIAGCVCVVLFNFCRFMSKSNFI